MIPRCAVEDLKLAKAYVIPLEEATAVIATHIAKTRSDCPAGKYIVALVMCEDSITAEIYEDPLK